jgi:nitrate reductase NapD
MSAAREAPAASDEIHIAGVLVHARPLWLATTVRAIDALAGADVVQSSAEGKLVVVLEAASTQQLLDLVDAIRATPAVVNVALVYQHAEAASSMQQEMSA